MILGLRFEFKFGCLYGVFGWDCGLKVASVGFCRWFEFLDFGGLIALGMIVSDGFWV